VRAALESLGARADDQAGWARAAAGILDRRDSAGVIAALAKSAAAEDPFLRKQAALALAFWSGSAAENELAEQTLVKLTRDDGRGIPLEITDKD
jgi:hypothetical protein